MRRQVESNGNEVENLFRASLSRARKTRDLRSEPRFRTHLRSGRIFDLQQRFICDCVIRDRSSNGARLLLPKNVTTPNLIVFLDEELKEFIRAEVRWRQDREIGIQKFRLGDERYTRPARAAASSPPSSDREKQQRGRDEQQASKEKRPGREFQIGKPPRQRD